MTKREKFLTWLALFLFAALVGAMTAAWSWLGGERAEPETFDTLRRMTLP